MRTALASALAVGWQTATSIPCILAERFSRPG
jgi:hypothetical protein